MTVEESIRRTTAEPAHGGSTGRKAFRFLAAIAVLGVLVYLFRDLRALFDGSAPEYREKIFYDPGNGLMWHRPYADPMSHEDAAAYCRTLRVREMDDWRLPTISELRTIVKGCSYTEQSGLCPVSDNCLLRECRDENCACGGEGSGPGEDGLYWQKDVWEHLPGKSRGFHWSSSEPADEGSLSAIWVMSFVTGAIDLGDPTLGGHIRCVSGPVPMRDRLRYYLIFRE